MMQLAKMWMMAGVVAMASGCAALGADYRYDPDDRAGNQCKNECLAAVDYYEREECLASCWDYNGGEFTPSAGCFAMQDKPIYKAPPEAIQPLPAPAAPTPPPATPTPPPNSPPADPPAAAPPAPSEDPLPPAAPSDT
jgi:hypothetical protein